MNPPRRVPVDRARDQEWHSVTVAMEWPRFEGILRAAMAKYGVKSYSRALRAALIEVTGADAGQETNDDGHERAVDPPE